jgi:hypothetical protein
MVRSLLHHARARGAGPLAAAALLVLALYTLGGVLFFDGGWGAASSHAGGGGREPGTLPAGCGAQVDEALAQLQQRVRTLAVLLSPMDPAIAGVAERLAGGGEGAGSGMSLFSWSDAAGTMFRFGQPTPLTQLRALADGLRSVNVALKAGVPGSDDDEGAAPADGEDEGGGGEGKRNSNVDGVGAGDGGSLGARATTTTAGSTSNTLVERLLEAAALGHRGYFAGMATLPNSAALALPPENATAAAAAGGGGDAPAVDAPRCPPCYGFLKPSCAPCRCAAASRSRSRSPAKSAAPTAGLVRGSGGGTGSAADGITGYDRSPRPAGRAFFVTYGDDKYARSRARLAAEAASYRGVFHAVLPLNRSSLEPRWAAAHAKLLAAPRGGGYWVWKPHLLLRVLTEHMDDDDVLLYADAGCTLVADPTPYLELAAAHGLVLFRGRSPQQAWTKGFTFAAVGLEMEQWGEEGQVVGGMLALQKRPWVLAFLREWLRLMTDDPRVVNDDDTSRLVPNHASFKEHRHDQSVLSLLAYKHGVFMAPYRGWPKERAYILAATRGRG